MKSQSHATKYLDIITVLLVLSALYVVFFVAPVERVMGLVQKVFYFHIANAWVGMLGFLVAAFAGFMYLAKGHTKWDQYGYSAVEISLVFLVIATVTGSIWARPVWNTWWTWDPRLTTTTIMILIYSAYMLLRQGVEDPDRRARFGAVYNIIGFISVPITFFSIRLSRTIHPVVIGSGDPGAKGTFQMTSDMRAVMFYCIFVFTFVFIDLFIHRVRLAKLSSQIEQLKLQADL